MKKPLNIHPYIRLLFLLAGMLGMIFTDDIYLLANFYLFAILPLTVWNSLLRQHVYFVLFGMVPILMSFVLLYILALDGEKGGWDYVLSRTVKIGAMAFTIQLALSIPKRYLIATFKAWKIKGDALMVALGSYIVWSDVVGRADKIITARFSRGFVGKRNLTNKARQFPSMLLPLVIGVLRSSTERSVSWEEKNIRKLLGTFETKAEKYPILPNLYMFVISICWFMAVGLTFYY